MEAQVRVFADRLQQDDRPAGRAVEEKTFDDERSAAVRRERALSLESRTAWEFLYVRMARRQFATVIVTAGDVASDIRGSAASGLRSLKQLRDIGLIRRTDYNRASGAWTVEIVDPFELGIGRAARGGHEQSELFDQDDQETGPCSPAPVEGSTAEEVRALSIATDAVEDTPSRRSARPPAAERPPPLGTSVDRCAEAQPSNLSKSSKKLELSNLSNLSEAQRSAAITTRREVREVGAERKRLGTSGDRNAAAKKDWAAEPKPIGPVKIDAALSGAIDRLMPTAADRAREIGGVVELIRDIVGDAVRSERPLLAIAEAVADRAFPPARLAAVCATFKEQRRRGQIRCEPGWYFLCAVEKSAWQIGLPLKLTGRKPPNKPR